MTERGRRRTSKWDLKEDSQYFQVGIREDNTWTGRAGESIQDAVSKKAKSDYNDIAQTVKAWDEDQSYNMSMSPGLDGWREQNRSRSPKSSSSRLHRSRSRSPPHGFRHEFEGRNDRSRSGSRASTPPCKDFMAGRCRRGGHCRFLHHDIRNYEGRKHSGSVRGENWRSRHEKGESLGFDDSEEQARYSQDKASGLHENHYEGYEGNWEKREGLRNMSAERCNNFLKGKCFKGSSCKYVHDTDIADDRGTRERAPYRRDRNTSFGHDYKREPDRTNNTPCKYFAAGNCLHGASCRFSHEGIVRDNLEGRSWDERWGQKKDDEKQSWHGPKWTDKAADSAHGNVEGRSVDDMLRHNVGKQDSLCGGLKWGDQSVDSDANSLLQRNGNNGVKLSDNAEGRLWESSKWIDEGAGSDMMKSSKWSSDYDGGRVGSKAESASWGDRKWSQRAVDSELSKSPQRRNDSDGRKVGNTTCQGPTWSDKRADQDVKKSSQFLNDNTGGHIGGLDSIDHGQLLNMAYAVPNRKQYLHFINNEGTAQANLDSQSQSLMEINSPSHEQNAAREVSGQHQHTSTVNIQTTVPEVANVQQTFRLSGDATSLPCKNGNVGTSTMKPQTEISISADALPAMVSFHGQSFNSNARNEISQPLSSFIMNAHGQHVPPVPSAAPRVPGFDLNEQVDQVSQPSSSPHYQTSLQGQAIMMQDLIDQKNSVVTSRTPLTQNVVTSEQVAQITNLSASLAQIFGKGQQLPQLYATLNSIPTGLVPSIPNSAGPVVPAVASFTQSNQVVVSSKEYDPISDSIELSKSNISFQHPEVLPNSTEQSKIADQEAPTPLKSMEPSSTAGAINGGDPSNDGSTEAKLHNQRQETKQFEPVANERADEHAIKVQDTVHLDDNDADGQNDEGDKKKDTKALRMFKFSLVESVKEILKPKWKEGQMSKEAHKTIVKKVVDKVISTFQGAHIPQTQEKIDHYLSYSKPKLTKLAQAYVEKYLKT